MKLFQILCVVMVSMPLVVTSTQSCQHADKKSGSQGLDELNHKRETLEQELRCLQSSVAALKNALVFNKGTSSGNKIYLTNGQTTTYNEAYTICAKAGGQLPSPQITEENEAILTLALQHKRDPFLGINDIGDEGTFRYPNGEEITYSNWAVDEPNDVLEVEDCVEMFSDGKWNDENCEEKRLIICEFS
ncbi:Hypothetical predicted protein [Pelobates cultripes]|uniref:C-type lectin domain-containing protein n=1 Tax=Pelobates cultripes TaxID=61616 RepID=A0AAD1WSC0_PELCU|nr:Hypothetical predicted protein [Pelobates cultripes]